MKGRRGLPPVIVALSGPESEPGDAHPRVDFFSSCLGQRDVVRIGEVFEAVAYQSSGDQ